MLRGGESSGKGAHLSNLNLEFGGRASDRTEKGTLDFGLSSLDGRVRFLKQNQELGLKNPQGVTWFCARSLELKRL